MLPRTFLLQFRKGFQKVSTTCFEIPPVTCASSCKSRKLGTFYISTKGSEVSSKNVSYLTCGAIRNYAKGKDKKKEKGKSKVVIDENKIAEVVNIESLKNGMQKAVTHLEEEFVRNLSLRSTTGAIESLSVNIEGKEHLLQEVAQVVRKNPKVVVINMSAFPQYIQEVLKAIEKSGMNLNPQQDGTTLFVPIPKITKEHRENLAKNAKQLFVKCKDMVRDVQIKFVKQIKKKEKISEDLARNVEQQIIAIADSYVHQAEQLLERKQHELIGKE